MKAEGNSALSSAEFHIFGHRGLPHHIRENTASSIEAALEAGADGCETDLRYLADGSLVLFHDDEREGRAVETLSRAELGGIEGEITLLSEIRPLADRGLLILEVKRRGDEAKLLEALSGWPRCVVSSFDHLLIRTLRELGAPFELGAILSGRLTETSSYLESLGASWFFPEHRLVDGPLVDECRNAGIRVVPWTTDRPERWELLRGLGCYGVITNVADEAVQWRRES
ncbi:MAG TPA: glycerophosphodiester phosphodiesterase [Thermoanaerobaculia bacterium]|nr:glycerophosphodiester phosphodiesterase [Thermoanaerobaculia bacterium]